MRGRRRLRWALRVVVILALSAAVVAAVIWRLATTFRSQPCLAPPAGAAPGVEVEGRRSGRSGPVTLAFAGDAMLGRGVSRALERQSPGAFWTGVTPALRDVEIFAFNLECAVTDRTEPWGSWKRYRFRVATGLARRLLTALPLASGAHRLVSLANNHVLDFGPEGLRSTTAVLDDAGVEHVGAGMTAAEAWRPAVLTTSRGVRVGVLAVADHCGCLQMGQWVAGRDQPGIAWVNLSAGRTAALLRAVRALDAAVDVTVISIHGGANYLDGPVPGWMRDVARDLVAAGADVVWSHSAHQVLPIERVEGRHVLYGTGGLVDDYRRRPRYRNDLGTIVRLEIAADGAQAAFVIPIRLRRRGPSLLKEHGADSEDVLRRVHSSESPPRDEGPSARRRAF